MTDPIPANLLVQTAACDERLQKLQIRAFANVGDNLTGEVILAVREVVAMVETLEKSRTITPAAPQVAGGGEEIVARVQEYCRLCLVNGVSDDCLALLVTRGNQQVRITDGEIRAFSDFHHSLAKELEGWRKTALADAGKMERLTQERDSAREAERGAKERMEAAQSRYKEEYAIVDRIWGIYDRPTMDELEGRSLYDLIKADRQELERLRTAPTPAAPCGTHSDLIKELTEMVATLAGIDPTDCESMPHDVAQQCGFGADALNKAIAALAETKAVEHE